MSQLSKKAKDCLILMSLDKTSNEWSDGYARLCEEYSEKAVLVKMEELQARGYCESGVSTRMGWLTPKGREALSK